MKINKILTLAFASVLLFSTSCRSDDNPENGNDGNAKYANGIFITNEGNFQTPSATVSFTSGDLAVQENDIYGKNNNNAALGDVLQNLAFYGDKAYLVLNNSNKITVVDRGTFKAVGEITTNVTQPRYIAFSGNNMYVTNSQNVSVFDANTLAFTKKIELNETAERIVPAGNNVFVQNAAFGTGNKITYIDNRTNTVKGSITVADGQIQKIITDGTQVYAIASDAGADSYIYTISGTGNLISTTTLTGISGAQNLVLDSGNFYFTSGMKVYKMAAGSSTVPSAPLFTATESGPFSGLYGFDVIDGKVYTSDANGFTAPSTVTVYDGGTGNVLKSFQTGIGTNGFYKN